MPDFEPVFRDGIGYCNALCGCAWDIEQEDRVIRFCGHDCSPSAPPARNDTVCVPWVRSLLSPPIPDEKVREAVERLVRDSRGAADMQGIGEDIRTLIDAYRAELGTSAAWHAQLSHLLATEPPKGTPMSTDNVIYVQRRNAEWASVNVPPVYYWYVWEDTASNESPKPPNGYPGYTSRHQALAHAHDMASQRRPSHNVQELPPQEWSSKTQAQQDAEWLREHAASLQGNFGKCVEPARLNEIAARLE